MAEHVVIKIDVNANTDGIEKVRARLAKLQLEAMAMNDKFAKLSGSTDKTDDSFTELEKSVKKTGDSMDDTSKSTKSLGSNIKLVDRHVGKAEKQFSKFDKILQFFGKKMQSVIKFGLKTFVLNLAATGIALAAVGGAFAVARKAVELWNKSFAAAMKVGSVAAASFLAVLSSLAAGQRQFAAASLSGSYGGFSKGTQNASTQLRALEKNTQLAILGTEALVGAFNSISKQTQMTSVLNSALTVMGDFAAASADPTKALSAAGDFLGKLTKNGKVTKEVLEAATQVGPEFQKALEDGMKKGLTSSGDILNALLGGEFSSSVAGTLTESNRTLFGTFKRNFGLIKADLADIGQSFLPKFTDAIEKMSRSLRSGFILIQGTLGNFANGSFVNTLTDGFDKLVHLSARLFNEYLPKAGTLVDSVRNIGEGISGAFKNVRDALRPLLAGANVLRDAFGPLISGLFKGFGGGVKNFSNLLVDNREGVMGFGQSLLNLFNKMGEVFGEMKKGLLQVLPIVKVIIDEIAALMGGLADIFGFFNSGFGWGKASMAGSALGMIAGGFGYAGLGRLGNGKGGVKGLVGRATDAFKGKSNDMVVNAGTVIVNGSVAASAEGSLASGGSGATVSTTAKQGGRLSRFAASTKSALTGSASRQIASMAAVVAISQLSQNKGSTSNILSGIAAGAGIGHAIAPGLGTAIGAGVGLLGGALLEGSPWGKAKRNKEAARSGASAFFGSRSDILTSQLEAGQYGDAMKGWSALQSIVGQLDVFQTIRGNIRDKYSNNEILDMLGVSGPDRYGDNKDAINAQILKMTEAGAGFALSDILDQNELSAFNKDSDAFVKQLSDMKDELSDSMNPIVKTLTSNFEMLNRVTGLSNSEIESMANTIGMDLAGGITNFSDAVSYALGVELPGSIEDLRYAITEGFVSAIDAVTSPILKAGAAKEAVDQSQQQVLEALYGNTYDKGLGAQFFKDMATFELLQTTDPTTGKQDPLAAFSHMNKLMGDNGIAYVSGHAFGGLGGTKFAQDQQEMLAAFWVQQAQEIGPQILGSLAAKLANDTGGAYSLDMNAIKGFDFSTLNMDQVGLLLNAIETMTFNTNTAESQINGILSRSGTSSIGVLSGSQVATNPETPTDPTAAFDDMVGRLNGSATTMTSASTTMQTAGTSQVAAGAIMTAASVNMMLAAARLSTIQIPTTDAPGGDTPTSRFARTLAKGGALSSMLGGKRSILSGIRNFNLGSMSSDHTTGAAIDIVGDNLGSLGKMINDTGGFAEMHGVAGNRHLHAVPGDTATPVTPGVPAMSQSSTNINVFPSPGMDEEALARKVHGMILTTQRSARERQ